MSPVDFKKVSCRPVGFKGKGPLIPVSDYSADSLCESLWCIQAAWGLNKH